MRKKNIIKFSLSPKRCDEARMNLVPLVSPAEGNDLSEDELARLTEPLVPSSEVIFDGFRGLRVPLTPSAVKSTLDHFINDDDVSPFFPSTPDNVSMHMPSQEEGYSTELSITQTSSEFGCPMHLERQLSFQPVIENWGDGGDVESSFVSSWVSSISSFGGQPLGSESFGSNEPGLEKDDDFSFPAPVAEECDLRALGSMILEDEAEEDKPNSHGKKVESLEMPAGSLVKRIDDHQSSILELTSRRPYLPSIVLPTTTVVQMKADSADSPQATPGSDNRRRGVVKRGNCHCKQTKCLKLYCECFSVGEVCEDKCGCKDCHNKSSDKGSVSHLSAIAKCLANKSRTFRPKTNILEAAETKEVFSTAPSKLMLSPILKKRLQGAPLPPRCYCKKSRCLKKYCDCFAGGFLCSKGHCGCVECKNTTSADSDSPETPLIAATYTTLQPIKKRPVKRALPGMLTEAVHSRPSKKGSMCSPDEESSVKSSGSFQVKLEKLDENFTPSKEHKDSRVEIEF